VFGIRLPFVDALRLGSLDALSLAVSDEAGHQALQRAIIRTSDETIIT
jgi:hypothetical protein